MTTKSVVLEAMHEMLQPLLEPGGDVPRLWGRYPYFYRSGDRTLDIVTVPGEGERQRQLKVTDRTGLMVVRGIVCAYGREHLRNDYLLGRLGIYKDPAIGSVVQVGQEGIQCGVHYRGRHDDPKTVATTLIARTLTCGRAFLVGGPGQGPNCTTCSEQLKCLTQEQRGG